MSWTLGDVGIASGLIVQPVRGAWSADLDLATDEVPSGTQRLSLPGLTLTGTVVDGGVSFAKLRVRVVGGAGGLGKTVPGQHFNRAAVRTVVDFLLGRVGEALSSDSDPAILARILEHWQHIEDTAGHGLDVLAEYLGTYWTVTPAGQVRIGAPTWAESTVEHELLAEDLVARTWLISSLDELVQPGTTFRGRRVGSVEHTVSGARARTLVRWDEDLDPFSADFRDLVQHFQHRTLPAYEAKVVMQNADGTLDLEPTDPKAGPGWKRVEIALQGLWQVRVQPGARAIVEFLDNDRTKPIVRQFLPGATFTEAKMDSGEASARKEDPVEVKLWLLVGPIGTSGGSAVVGVSPVQVPPTPPAVVTVLPVTLSMGKITGGSAVVKVA